MANINFGMDGLALEGSRWYNANTGDSFVIRSNYFEDNNMMIQTTDGRIINMNQMDNYVQWTGKDLPPKTPLVQKSSSLPREVQDIIQTTYTTSDQLPQDSDMIYSTNPSPAPISTPFVQTSQTEDQRMVARVLSKASSPKVDYKISWTKFPTRQMEMLVDFMGVDMEDVCNFYADQIDMNAIRENIKQQISDYISLHQATEDSEPKVEPKKPIKKK